MSAYLVVNHDVVGGDADLPRVDVLAEDDAPRRHLQVGALYFVCVPIPVTFGFT